MGALFLYSQESVYEGQFVLSAKSLQSCPILVTPCTVARQAPLSMGFFRQKYWSVLPFPPPGGLPNPGIKLESPALAGRFFTIKPPGKPVVSNIKCLLIRIIIRMCTGCPL